MCTTCWRNWPPNVFCRDLRGNKSARFARGTDASLSAGLPVLLQFAARLAALDHVQVSLQDVEAASADHFAGYQGAHERKLALAHSVTELGLALTINAVIHRANIGRVGAMVDLAASLGAGRVEIRMPSLTAGSDAIARR